MRTIWNISFWISLRENCDRHEKYFQHPLREERKKNKLIKKKKTKIEMRDFS